MHVTKLEDHLYLIDVETAGIKNFVASYVLKDEKVIIVETGPTSSVPNLLAGLRELQVKLEDVAYVAVSHVHLDHAGGVGTLIKSLPNAKVVVHQRGAPHLISPEKLWQQSQEVLTSSITDLYGAPEPVPPERVAAAADGMVFDAGKGVRLKVVETTGHASHHQSYQDLLSGGVFPGDAAGIYLNEIGVVVPTTPAPFRMDIALAALDKLMGLRPKALYYSHFGRTLDAVDKLQTYVRQLELWAKIAKEELDKGNDVEAASRRIMEEDEAVRKAVEYIRGDPILNKTVLNQSVYGVIDFVAKHGLAST